MGALRPYRENRVSSFETVSGFWFLEKNFLVGRASVPASGIFSQKDCVVARLQGDECHPSHERQPVVHHPRLRGGDDWGKRGKAFLWFADDFYN
jgi:hypothetical protein